MDTYLMFFIAIIPIIWLVIVLGRSILPAYKAACTTLLLALLLALIFWKENISDVFTSAIEGAAFAVWPIIAVIIAAVFTYKLSIHTKNMDLIKEMLSGITTDKRIQVLILAWGFSGFLEAFSGYGAPLAIPASILVALGFEPIFAAVLCLIANTGPTAYGSLGLAITTLSKVTGLDVDKLNSYVGIQLSPLAVLIPIVLVVVTGKSIKALKGVVGITLISGISFAIPFLISACFMSEQLPTLLGSIFSLGMTILWANLFHKDKKGRGANIPIKKALLAWLPYILLFTFVIVASPLFPFVNNFLNHFKSSIVIYTGEGAKPLDFKWLSSPASLVFLAAVIGGLIQGARIREIMMVFWDTQKQMTKSIITVISIVAAAKVMSYSGMISSIAIVLVKVSGSYFTILSPMLGTLGTFVTGSDLSSNVLFGSLQKEVALSINANPYWLAAANTAGATAGKMISPQSIAVATSAIGLAGSEGKIFSKTIKFSLGYLLIICVIVLVGSIFV